MTDSDIIKLLFARDEGGIKALSDKYKGYCTAIALNIIGIKEDAEECVNDTFLKAWNLIPPNDPKILSAFLGKLVRNCAINKLNMNLAGKRGGGNTGLILEELEELIPSKSSVEQEQEQRETVSEINGFLHTLSEQKRNIFICRYWYCDSVKDIGQQFGLSENNVSVTLNRIRKKLKAYLEKRGY